MEKKSRLLQIKRYLEERTDEAHPSAIADILSYLESEGVQADRRTVSRDIERLMESGMDIVCNAGRRNEYFCGGKGFELPELKLLVDAVQASRFISHRKSQALIGKLLSLGAPTRQTSSTAICTRISR
jgi:predicted DNA-binding transcriptional regulator YafY